MIYVVSLSTGALVQGVYSSLDKAKAAVGAHFAALDTKYNAALWVDSYRNDRQYIYPDAHNGLLTDVYILGYKLDEPLEMA